MGSTFHCNGTITEGRIILDGVYGLFNPVCYRTIELEGVGELAAFLAAEGRRQALLAAARRAGRRFPPAAAAGGGGFGPALDLALPLLQFSIQFPAVAKVKEAAEAAAIEHLQSETGDNDDPGGVLAVSARPPRVAVRGAGLLARLAAAGISYSEDPFGDGNKATIDLPPCLSDEPPKQTFVDAVDNILQALIQTDGGNRADINYSLNGESSV